MQFIDTHAHIFTRQFEHDLDEVVDRARGEGIKKIYMPNIDRDSIEQMLRLEKQYPDFCVPMIGLHPCSVGERYEEDLQVIESWLSKRKFAGIGETGTDQYWDTTYSEQQIESLKTHIGWAKKYCVPIILHSRDSLDTTISVIEENNSNELNGIFHCFTGSSDQAARIIDMGFSLGIGGIITFKNSNLSEVLANIPLASLVLETDSPYLSPHPYRGKRNEPGRIPLIAEKLSELYELRMEEIARMTTENAERIFKVE